MKEDEFYCDGINILLKLVELIKHKDKITYDHSNRVALYSKMLGLEMGLDKKDVELLYIGGKLHDIGKIYISDKILMKNSKLNIDEIEFMKQHTIIGSSVIPDKSQYKSIKQIVRNHHERIDGLGYPDGLKGDQIPLFVKIISVADSFDAMTTNRKYNKPKTIEEAIIELEKCSKKSIIDSNIISQQFDPDIVNQFIYMINKYHSKEK